VVFIHDTRDKIGKHDEIEKTIEEKGHKIIRSKMYVGDISLLENQNVCIDIKQGLAEVYSNIIQSNVRFKNECIRAKEAGISLVVLIPDELVDCVENVHKWRNPRREKWFMVDAAHKNGKMLKYKQSARPPVSSEQLQKAMETMASRYGVRWEFSKKKNMGESVLRILGVKND
jgi:paraquat-inducible protein B